MELLNILTSIIQWKRCGCLYFWKIQEQLGQTETTTSLFAKEQIIEMIFDLSLRGKHLELIKYDCDFLKRDIQFRLRIADGIDLQTPDIADAVSRLP